MKDNEALREKSSAVVQCDMKHYRNSDHEKIPATFDQNSTEVHWLLSVIVSASQNKFDEKSNVWKQKEGIKDFTVKVHIITTVLRQSIWKNLLNTIVMQRKGSGSLLQHMKDQISFVESSFSTLWIK